MVEERTQPERPVVADTAVNPKLVKLIPDEFNTKQNKKNLTYLGRCSCTIHILVQCLGLKILPLG